VNPPSHDNNPASPRNSAGKKPTLLLVDDDREHLNVLSSLLRGKYQVLSANSGQEAIVTLEQEVIDLVLLDVQMPTTNGYEFCERLKASPATVAIPIIFVTGCVSAEDEIHGLSVGAVDYVYKPINLPVLEARIQTHLDVRRQMQAVELESRTDALTGLANRLQLNETLERQWLTMLRRQEPLSLIMIDIDHFKFYNDHYGHLQGDECLARVAAAISGSQHRPDDVVGRYGGEEFLVVLPNTSAKGAEQVAARMHRAVQDLQLPHVGNPIAEFVSISLGVASHRPVGKRRGSPIDLPTLLTQADECLFRAKSSGRNQYCVASSE
jgi:diguanylate cyclase (GGDEF)-like protein